MRFGFLLITGSDTPARVQETERRRRCGEAVVGVLLSLLCLYAYPGRAAGVEYLDNRELSARIQRLAEENRQRVHTSTLARDGKERQILMLECTTAETTQRGQQPAFLAVAGIEGNDLAGSTILLTWLEELIGNSVTNVDIRQLLDSTTLYVLPRLNPEGAERFFTKPRFESAVNERPVDDDHDGLVDEDGPEDLDGNGLITAMRVSDPAGEYLPDPQEPRLLIKADRSKGEIGVWRLLSEGVDNDHDDAWNEDGPGGVNLNRNFPYGFRFFQPDSGMHPMSEPVTRALADFVVAHPNIGIVFVFGAADNLIQTPKAEAPKRPPTTIHEEDLPWFRELGKQWRDCLGLKKELTGKTEPGTFPDWIYFDRGRLALAARPWSPAVQIELAKAAEPKGEEKAKESKTEPDGDKPDKGASAKRDADKSKKPETDTRNEEERAFLKWADKNAPELFVPWKAIEHPDFPGKTVEAGEFAPFAKSNPPQLLLEAYARNEGRFLSSLLGKLPRVGIRKLEAKHLGSSVFELTLQVENKGYLPTMLAQGALSREVNPTRVVLDLPQEMFLSGMRRTFLPVIEGSGGMKEARYILNGKGHPSVDIEIVSALGGSIKTNVVLKETP